MATTVLDVLKGDIEKLMSNRKEALVNGSPTTFDQYREQVGVVRGLAMALHAVEERVQSEDADDE